MPALGGGASVRERGPSSGWGSPPGLARAGVVTAGLWIGLLGPVEVRRGNSSVRISAAKQRVVLALLALRCGEVVSVDALVDGLWPGGPPPTALKTVQGYVSAL